jgi:hypothetical protein
MVVDVVSLSVCLALILLHGARAFSPGYVNEIGAWRVNAESGLAALKRQPIQIANSTSDLFILVLR